MVVGAVKAALMDAYRRFGERLCAVLETALIIAKRNKVLNANSMGDFDYRSLIEELSKRGYRYNPSQLLRALEREYGVIETTYHSGSQHWYKFVDLEAVEQFINEIKGVSEILEEPEVIALKIQIRSLGLRTWLEQLKKWSIKPRLTRVDRKRFQEFAFRVLPRIVKILRRAEEFEDLILSEIEILKEIIELAYMVAERMDSAESVAARYDQRVESIQTPIELD